MTAPIVTVRGEAEVYGPPDLATLTCTLHASGDSAERVRGRLATGSQAVAELLGQFASALERHSSSGLHVYPEFHRRTPTRITGYRGTFSTTVVVADFEVLSELIMGLSGLPDSQLDGPWWSLRRDNPMFREVRLAAIADARRRADDYAAAFGATVAELVEVSDLDGGFGGGARWRGDGDGEGGRRCGLRLRAGGADGVGAGDRAVHGPRRVVRRLRWTTRSGCTRWSGRPAGARRRPSTPPPARAAAGFDLLEVPLLDPATVDGPATAALFQRHHLRPGLLARPVLRHRHLQRGHREGGGWGAAAACCPRGHRRAGRPLPHRSDLQRDGQVHPAAHHGRHGQLGDRAPGLAQAAAGRGITVGLEAVNRYETNLVNTVADALRHIEAIGEDNVVVHLDVYHANIEEGDLGRPVRLAGDRLGYVHVGESHRGYLGSGTIDFAAFFRALVTAGYGGPITFESFSSAVVLGRVRRRPRGVAQPVG